MVIYDAIVPRTSGMTAAIAVYALYILSIPSLAIFAPIGFVVALVARRDASPLAVAHFNDQIRIFWIALAWGVVVFTASILAWMLTIVLIGFPLLWLIGAVGFLVMVWFTVRSVIGLLRLLDHASPRSSVS